MDTSIGKIINNALCMEEFMFDLFFETGEAIKLIFRCKLEIKEDNFIPFVDEDYESMRNQGMDISEKMYFFMPDQRVEKADNEIIVVTQYEKSCIFKAAAIIENYCKESEKVLQNYDEKLKYVASMIPEVFIRGTKYEKNTADK